MSLMAIITATVRRDRTVKGVANTDQVDPQSETPPLPHVITLVSADIGAGSQERPWATKLQPVCWVATCMAAHKPTKCQIAGGCAREETHSLAHANE